MKYFIDSANPEKIKAVLNGFPADGITTNPTIISRENTELLPLLKTIRALAGEKLLFVQVTAKQHEKMIAEAMLIKENIGGNLCIKIPSDQEGLMAVKALSSLGIPTAATAVYSVQQAMMFAAAGASYVAPYLSHIDNMCVDSSEIAGDMAKLLAVHFPKTEVLAASFRVAEQINRVLMSGVGAVTIAPEMFSALVANRQTEAELEAFDRNWRAVYGDRTLGDMIGG